jgi:DNA-directed RNA polymerase subunit E'/Rpb7
MDLSNAIRPLKRISDAGPDANTRRLVFFGKNPVISEDDSVRWRIESVSKEKREINSAQMRL